ncbi:MAG: HAMP domain-containing histidine kinase [Candidatus Eremiobacteraeota bacterium]|nr:HAMP domain-containing histidine kinase [Candidatus Eremiobacteraeota bacterium]
MGTILTAALLLSAAAFWLVSNGLFRATGLQDHGRPSMWEEWHEQELGEIVERQDWTALRDTILQYSPHSNSVAFLTDDGLLKPLVGIPIDSERLVSRVYETRRWLHEVTPETVTRAIPARDKDGSILGVLVLRMEGGPEVHERQKPHLEWTSYGCAMIAGLLLCWFTLAQGRRFSTRLEKFTRAAVGISQGQLTRLDIPVVPKDLAELARAFNSMAEQLEERLLSLEEARARAESADQMRRDFMAEIAHSLGTPLSAVQLGLAQLKQSDGGIDEIEEMEERVDWLSLTTRRLVKLACWEIVEPEIRIGPMTLLEPIVQSLELLENKLLEADIEVELGRFLEVGVWADEEALRSIFHALLENCIQHSGGSCLLTIWAQSVSVDEVEVLVSDTGRGMSEETLARAQERYFTKGRTGLGLAIVKRLLNAHGTRLKIESEWGQGSLFRFTLRKGEAGK